MMQEVVPCSSSNVSFNIILQIEKASSDVDREHVLKDNEAVLGTR